MGSEYPSPETTLVIIFGASEFPKTTQLAPSKAFRNSATQIKIYFLDREGFNLPPENLLDLFDAPEPQPNLNEKIAKFLDTRLAEMGKQSRPARDLVFYYVGHGGFSHGDNEYFLAIRDTRERNEYFSSYPIKSLAHTLKEHARFLRRYLILDSCFSAAAYKVFMAPPLEVACQKTLEEFPPRGTALLCASGPRDPAIILPSQEYTMFSDALVSVLRHGSEEEPEKLSLATLSSLTWAEIRERNLTDAVRPEVHSPEMREGDVAALPLFPNPATRIIKKVRLFVDTLPQAATVRILNLEVNFSQGMVLNPGSYHIEVSAEGYENQRKWIETEAGKDNHLHFKLKSKESVPENIAKERQGNERQDGEHEKMPQPEKDDATSDNSVKKILQTFLVIVVAVAAFIGAWHQYDRTKSKEDPPKINSVVVPTPPVHSEEITIPLYTTKNDSVIHVAQGTVCIIQISHGGFPTQVAAQNGRSDIIFKVTMNENELLTSRGQYKQTRNGEWHITQNYKSKPLASGDYLVHGITLRKPNQFVNERRFTIKVR